MSAQRRSGRKRAANTRISDLPESSPSERSRPAPKKRKASTTSSRRSQKRRTNGDADLGGPDNDTEDELEEESFVSIEESESQQIAELVISHLGAPEEETEAQRTLGPERWRDTPNISAFAKISGREWAFYALRPRITIGRQGVEGSQEDVDIDLGPNKLISRAHAEVYYDAEREAWLLSVNGRNAVKVNDAQVKRNDVRELESGSILEIAGTQMLFQLANQAVNIDPAFLNRLAEIAGPSENGSSTAQRPPTPPRDQTPDGILPNDDTNPMMTPSRPTAQPRTPEQSFKREHPPSSKKKSPYKRGMLMESTEQIDYAADGSKDIKPSCSYASMITWAILSVPEEAISLNGIYEWIRSHYAYYRLTPSGWQNSIRHNLSLNASFKKVPRRSDEPGKGMKWTFVPENREVTIAAANRQASKGGGRSSSAPVSPASMHPPQGTLTMPDRGGEMTLSPVRQSSPGPSYPPPQQDLTTPSHDTFKQPGLPVYAPTQGSLPVLSDETSPMPRRYANGRVAHLPGSSPTLTSSYGNLDLPSHTPAPRAFNLSLNQPNTAKLPTSHMTPTTPAPFWRPFQNGLGSTPAQFPDSSPVKLGGAPPLSSSPPPMVGHGTESPTRQGGSSQGPRNPKSLPQGELAGNGLQNGNGIAPSSSIGPAEDASPEEQEGGIDLLKGFTKISTYHQPPRSQVSQAQAR